MSKIEQLIARLESHEPSSISEDLPDAGILVLLTRNADQPEIILTQRAAHLSTHQGQVAFPGGKFDAEDGTVLNTALREAHEEIGLAPEFVEIVGSCQ